jgi:phage-related baseplate assembly protein
MIDRNDLKIFGLTPAAVLASVQADFVAQTGRPIQPGQSDMLVLNVLAYHIYLFREQADEAIRNSLVPFASAPMLDYLGLFVGVTRLSASGAATVLSFSTGGNNPSALVIPAATRVSTQDGQLVFETVTDLTLPAGYDGSTPVTVEAVCTTLGAAGNGQVPTVILDPQSYVVGFTATNPEGGTDGETDEQLRARIQDAPNSFSVAGPAKAYEFFAKTAHPSITTAPGEVTTYILVPGGVPGPTILAAVEAILDPEYTRPLCDSPIAAAPTVKGYDLKVELELYLKTDANAEKAAAIKALKEYVGNRASGLGRDVVREKLSALAMTVGTYRANVITPAATLVVAEDEVAICNSITVNVIGFNHG